MSKDNIPTFFKPKSSQSDSSSTSSSRSTRQQNIDKHIEAVIGTNDDAASCKLSAVNIGYYKDEFVQYFVKTPIRRPPLINRGFFSRVEAIEQFIKQFFAIYSDSTKPIQIVSLGCGFDTLYFRMKVMLCFNYDMQLCYVML
ncbi:hypothetical protein PPL_02800 [Heterostelium album PN500]|uniref:[phosphatase 2A protein]-leucine-carboxy methyltransferase n=1 Tax=Heterostelium pallidum (strain ATCC 26659 / Pp 5 / PN500) TaxID=670386 RepID=D3B335_HETP5|nr:hypothetical protein PPL_02800 [Heterostelium album PN500]EFA83733.1 hypothetical protein PPL_02800 [Heterostelium album PN500]|eukprot:XP_020435850.1 hypothetical protein PPL_02800 [Heterostelium album PN500]